MSSVLHLVKVLYELLLVFAFTVAFVYSDFKTMKQRVSSGLKLLFFISTLKFPNYFKHYRNHKAQFLQFFLELRGL